MKTNKKITKILGGITASALIASMMVAPAFAADPTYRSSTGQYTETVAYDSSVTTASTEVLIDTKFHYLDYTPEIDITYMWQEDLEWTYIRNGQSGIWMKSNNEQTMLTIMKNTYNVTADTLASLVADDDKWNVVKDGFASFAGQEPNCHVMAFVNNADNQVEVSFQEQKKALSSTASGTITKEAATIGGSATNAIDRYLDYRAFKPISNANSESTTILEAYGDQTNVYTIGVGETPVTSLGMNANVRYVGITPKTTFKPTDYAPWIASNKEFNNAAGQPVEAQLKLIFTKVDQ